MNRVGGLAFSVIAISACAEPPIDGRAPTAARAALTHGVVCGDGTRGEGEDCDDGNVDDGDGCSSSCRLEDGV